MCNPLLFAAALAAGGAGSNYMGQRRVNNAREDSLMAEGDRQRNFQNQANDIIEQQTVQQSPAAQNQAFAETAERRTAALTPSQSDAASLPTSGSAPIQVNGEIARQISDAVRAGRSRLSAQARLSAYDENQFNNRLGLNRGATDIGQIADFSRGSSGVLPFELQGAENAGRGWKNAADLFNLGAQGLSLYGMTRAPDAGVSQVVPERNYSPAPPRAPTRLWKPTPTAGTSSTQSPARKPASTQRAG